MNTLVRMAVTAYSASLAKRPLLTEMITSGGLWCLGDVVTQYMEQQQQGHNVDWRRTASQTVYAAAVWGPAAHVWYHWLDAACRKWWGGNNNSVRPSRLVATKLALEVVALHPVAILAYFGVVGTMNGESLDTIYRQLQRDYLPTLLMEIVLWTPLDVLNFACVPVRHQLLVVNCGCLVESIALSYIKNNGVPSLPFTNSNSNNKNTVELRRLHSTATTDSSKTETEKAV